MRRVYQIISDLSDSAVWGVFLIFWTNILLYQIGRMNQILQWSPVVWGGVGEVDPC